MAVARDPGAANELSLVTVGGGAGTPIFKSVTGFGEIKDNEFSLMPPGSGVANKLYIPETSTFFNKAIADALAANAAAAPAAPDGHDGNRLLPGALRVIQKTIQESIAAGNKRCRINNGSNIKKGMLGVVDWGNPGYEDQLDNITFCPLSSICDAAGGQCTVNKPINTMTENARCGIEYGVMHVKLENIENVDQTTGVPSAPTSSRISMEFKMTSFQSNGKPCNDNTQKPSFAMVEMHVKLGEEVIINIGQLQDKNNEYRDPNPDTNGSLKSSGMAQPPGLKIVLNDSNTPLKAVNAVTEVTKTVMDITQHKGYGGSWTAFTNDITYRTTGVDEPRRKNAVRNRILINNKSIVKSIGDTAQELNVFANEGGYGKIGGVVQLDKHKRVGNTILPPTLLLQPTTHISLGHRRSRRTRPKLTRWV